jgi:hypothetical protein
MYEHAALLLTIVANYEMTVDFLCEMDKVRYKPPLHVDRALWVSYYHRWFNRCLLSPSHVQLVQLVESPVFASLRLQLLDPQQYPFLFRALYALLMILPQSAAFVTLQR